ncbi:MAG: GNAT family N-acetyltransferase [Cyanobacteria bacterium P01_A01_bin.45]
MIETQIKSASEKDIEQIISSIVLAFATDPVIRWMYPCAHQYLRNFPEFIQIFAGKAFEHQTVYYTDNYAAAAFWYPPDSQPDSDAIGAFLQQTIPEQQQEEIFSVLEQMNNYHPQDSYWYLAMLGVEANQQHKGYGSALVKHKLEECDTQGAIAYLESSKPENIPFYEKHGFQVIGEIQAGNSPTIFPMLRSV